ncbi:MAG: DUF2953 domain-containing protein [[Ruminococcus] gnavus]|nr:DUF2953 domain-containing protein [Mediterraneibacter gnavus]
MIHILLLILKIIGWILLVILGILLLLAAIFLLVPVTYEGELHGSGEWKRISGSLKVSWLYSLVKGEIFYREGVMDWKFRLAWKKFSCEQTEEAAGSVVLKEDTPKETNIPKTESSSDGTGQTQFQKQEQPGTEKKQRQKEREKEKSSALKPGLEERISEKIERIQCTFRKICDMLRSLAKKKERMTEFLTDEIHQSAFMKGMTELRRLFRFLKPSHCEADLEFGFSDPSVTGYVLAGVSMVYPFVGEHVEIAPNFEEQLLVGSARITGKIRACYFVIVVWNLFWNKNVRTTISHIRKFRF